MERPSDLRFCKPGQMAGTNPAVRPIVSPCGNAQIRTYLNWIGFTHDRSTRPVGPILECGRRAPGARKDRCRRNRAAAWPQLARRGVLIAHRLCPLRLAAAKGRV